MANVNINAGNISSIRLTEQGSAPAAPASGYGKTYLGDDGLLKLRRPTGSAFAVAASYGASSELTIATGAITVTSAHHTVDTQADAGSDELDTISGLAAGQLAYLRAENDARSVVVKHGTGNIYTLSAADITLDTDDKGVLVFSPDGTRVFVVGDGNSGIAGIAVEEAGSSIVAAATTLDFKDSNVEDDGSNQAGVYQNIPLICQGRLTLTTGTPVTTADVTAATTLYFTPYGGDQVSLYDGTRWKKYTFTERSIAIPATTATNYDVYLYDNAGTLTLDLAAWTNDTTRATALTTQDGVYVKTGATARRYLGTVRTTSVSGQCEDSDTSRLVWNYARRVERHLFCVDTTDSWTYTTATWRAANNNTTLGQGRVEAVIGVAEDAIRAVCQGLAINTGAVAGSSGVGIDSTAANSAAVNGSGIGSSFTVPLVAHYVGIPAAGYHYIQRLEISAASGTTTWYGDAGVTYLQSGMVVQMKG